MSNPERTSTKIPLRSHTMASQSSADGEGPPCRLLDLPPEIRVLIFEQVFLPGTLPTAWSFISHFGGEEFASRPPNAQRPQSFPEVLRVCKKVNSEATDVLWDSVEFRVRLEDFVTTEEGVIGGLDCAGFLRRARHLALMIAIGPKGITNPQYIERLESLITKVNSMVRLKNLRVEFFTDGIVFPGLDQVLSTVSKIRVDCKVEVSLKAYSGVTEANPDGFDAMVEKIKGCVPGTRSVSSLPNLV